MDRKEPQFSKCLVLTSNALLFQLGGLVLAGGIFLLTSEWNDLDSDAINNIVFFALVLGCLWVGIGLFGCCTLTCRLRRLEYLFLLVVLITTAATGYSIYVLGYTSDNLKVETYPANDYCYETQDFTRAEEDLQTNFNDLYEDNCPADIGNGVCSCDEAIDMDSGETMENCENAFQNDVCHCCDAYICCKQSINKFVVDKLGFLKFGFYGLITVQAVIILFTAHHIWNTVDSKEDRTISRRTDLRETEYSGRNTVNMDWGRTSAANREVLRRASMEGSRDTGVQMQHIAPRV